MTSPNLPGVLGQAAAERMPEADALRLAVSVVRAQYPEDIFPPDSESIDCQSAKFARGLCDQIIEIAEVLTRGDN